MDETRKATGRRPTLLVVNQVRQKIGVMFGSPDTLPGGVGQLFSASMIVKMRRGKYELTDGESKIPLSVELHGMIEKSKVSPPRYEYSFRLALNDHVDKDIQIKKGEIKEFDEVRKIAEANGLFVKKDGKYYYGKHEYARLHELWADWIYNREGLEKVKKDLLSILV
jgi:recombination protein RecA